MNLSLNVLSEYPLNLSNLIVVETEKSGETCDIDGSHLTNNFEISNNDHPQTMHCLVQASKCDSTILESSRTCQGVEALQLLLMVMSGYRDSSKSLELNLIWFLSHNPSIYMVSFDVNAHVKNVSYSGYDLSNSQDFNYDRIHEFFALHLFSCKYLSSNSGWECASLIESWNCEFDHLKDYLYSQELYLPNFSLNCQLPDLLMNLLMQIFPFITLEISLCDDKCTSCHKNQDLLYSPCLNRFHAFTMLSSF